MTGCCELRDLLIAEGYAAVPLDDEASVSLGPSFEVFEIIAANRGVRKRHAAVSD